MPFPFPPAPAPTQTVDAQSLINITAQKFGANNTSTDFINKATQSIWSVISDINLKLNIQLLLDSDTNLITFSLNNIQPGVMFSVFSLGLDYYMSILGFWETENIPEVEARYRKQLMDLWRSFNQGRHMKSRFGHMPPYPFVRYQGNPALNFLPPYDPYIP